VTGSCELIDSLGAELRPPGSRSLNRQEERSPYLIAGKEDSAIVSQLTNPSERFGLLSYSSMNIGDEIQSLAATRFLPRVDDYVHRESLHNLSGKPTKVIMNGWWMWRPQNFPPSKKIIPLLTSMHLRKEKYSFFSTKRAVEYLHRHGPVGARDEQTLEFLQGVGVPSYFSGCLTLTLRPNPSVTRQDFVLAIDLPPKALAALRKTSERPVHHIHPVLNPSLSFSDRLSLARVFLSMIQSASLVVSPRLHSLLPALALETPAVRVSTSNDSMDAKGRFSGYENFLHTIEMKALESESKVFDVNAPLRNPNEHLKVARELTRTAKEFTGHDLARTLTMSFEEASMTSLWLHRKRRENLQIGLWMVARADLARVLRRRLTSKQNKHDLGRDARTGFLG
jgi:hypothetical protein